MTTATNVSGSVQPRKTKGGKKFYARIRLNGREFTRLIGPAWNSGGKPPFGYYTLRTAKEALSEFLVELRREGIPDPDQDGKTFGDAVAEWLRYCEQEAECKPSTIRDYRNTTRGAILPEFGEDTALDLIDQDRIEAYRSALLSEGRLSTRTIQKHMVVLHGIFKRAVRLRWIPQNPVENVERVKVRSSGEFNVLAVEQVEAVARAAEGPMFAAAIKVAAYTGLRTGELRALRWRDVDFATYNLHVRKNLPAGGENGSPKSGKVRSVPLMDEAARELDKLTRRDEATGPDDLVFCWDGGGTLSEDTLRDALYEALEGAGIDRKADFPAKQGFTFHDLRHTFGTLAVRVWPLSDVRAYMGHAQIETTMKYAHHIPKEKAAAELSALIEREKQGPPVPRSVPRIRGNGTELRLVPTA